MVYKNKKSRKAIPGYTLIPKEGYYQVRKIGITGARVNEDPAFIMTRKLSDEFAVAAKLGTLIRNVMLGNANIIKCPAVLTAALINILQTDLNNPVGKRTFLNADFSSLVNFQFNHTLTWQDVTTLRCKVKQDSKKQQWKVSIPSFVPRKEIKGIRSNTHCRIRFILLSINLTNMKAEKQVQKTTLLPWKEIVVPQKELVFKINEKLPFLHLLTVTIDWYEQTNQKNRVLNSDTPVPFTIISVSAGE